MVDTTDLHILNCLTESCICSFDLRVTTKAKWVCIGIEYCGSVKTAGWPSLPYYQREYKAVYTRLRGDTWRRRHLRSVLSNFIKTLQGFPFSTFFSWISCIPGYGIVWEYCLLHFKYERLVNIYQKYVSVFIFFFTINTSVIRHMSWLYMNRSWDTLLCCSRSQETPYYSRPTFRYYRGLLFVKRKVSILMRLACGPIWDMMTPRPIEDGS